MSSIAELCGSSVSGETSALVFIVAIPVYTPINSEWGFSFPTSLPVLVVICFLDISHSDWVRHNLKGASFCMFPKAKYIECF